MTQKEKRIKAIEMYEAGKSITKIAKTLRVPRSWVREVVSCHKAAQSDTRSIDFNEFCCNEELVKGLSERLLSVSEEKGKRRLRWSKKAIVEFLSGYMPERQANEFLEFFVEKEYGGWEKLREKVLGKDFSSPSRGPLWKGEKFGDCWEFDATGWKDAFYLLGMDRFSQFVFPEFVKVEGVKRRANYYNVEFTALDVALFFETLFLNWGVPQTIKIDCAKNLNAGYIREALDSLGVRVLLSRPYRAKEKYIERAIRTLKSIARQHDFLLEDAIPRYNSEPHSHFKEPRLYIANYEGFQGTRELPEEEIRFAFSEKRIYEDFRSEYIQWDGVRYQVGGLGRVWGVGRGEKRVVMAVRLLREAGKLFIYTESKEGEGLSWKGRSWKFLKEALPLYPVEVEIPSSVELKRLQVERKKIEKEERKLYARLSEVKAKKQAVKEVEPPKQKPIVNLTELIPYIHRLLREGKEVDEALWKRFQRAKERFGHIYKSELEDIQKMLSKDTPLH